MTKAYVDQKGKLIDPEKHIKSLKSENREKKMSQDLFLGPPRNDDITPVSVHRNQVTADHG